MGSSSRPIDHGTNRVGRPNHHTTRIDANPPRYRTCDSHRIRLAQRLLNPSRAFSSTSPIQSSIKLAFPRRYEMGVFPPPIVCIGLASSRTKGAFRRARACRKADHYISKKTTTTSQAGSDSLLFSLGLNIDGESIDRSSSPTSLTNIRYNFTSRHGQKKERASLGGPPYAGECLLSLL